MSFCAPFGAVPFDLIKNEHFLPAIESAIREAKDKLNAIKKDSARPTFENTVAALAESSGTLEQTKNIFFHLHGVHSSDEIRNLAKKISPLLSNFANDVLLDEELFSKIKTVWDEREETGLNGEALKLTEEYHSDFVRNGALLSVPEKEKLRKIDEKLSELSLLFSDNILKATHNYVLEITPAEASEALKGLPDSVIEDAEIAATARHKDGNKDGNKDEIKNGYVFTLDLHSYIPFMKYAENRILRERLYRAYTSRSFMKENHDNRAIVLEIARLRQQRAKLLGYPSHAHFVLERRMANQVETVQNFLHSLLQKARPFAEREIAEMKALHQKSQQTPQQTPQPGAQQELMPWDYAFYAEKLKMEKFNIDDEILRPYFQLEKVVAGVFAVANKLYSLEFEEVNNVPLYHPEVKVYAVSTGDSVRKFVGLLYMDFFPRTQKRSGAWMLNLQEQYYDQHTATDHRPHVGIVCNFGRPTDTRPALLSLNEVATLFHEFGHALHGLFSQCHYRQLSGTNVFWDFVELPSQLMENWVYEKESLDLFAKDYRTGNPIPNEYIEKIKASMQFHQGYSTLRQITFGLLDLAWHAQDKEFSIESDDIDKFEQQAIAATQLLPLVEGSNISCAFSHIFSGGYSSGYYSYKWAEVLDADAFEYFLEKGIFNRDLGEQLKQNILSKGGTMHPMELYKNFRGKEPSIGALLMRAGLNSGKSE
ncbi:MAG: M3 family metallopeptidase [Oligoflexia bacterium]|nr:M3 family metallopeptidase [Oligoflexia bacterium]